MRITSVIVLFLTSIVSFTPIDSSAQRVAGDNQRRVINWRKLQGLGSNGGNVMIKDAMGFLWVGGYDGGLCRFDGGVFKKYRPTGQAGMINSESINALVEDSLHNIWIGTREGLSRYEGKSDSFRNFVTEPDSLPKDKFIAYATNKSIIPFWATRRAVFCYESVLRTIVSYDVNSFEKKSVLDLKLSGINLFGGVSVNSTILDTASNCIWGFGEYGPGTGDGILQISLADGHVKKYTWACTKKNLAHRHSAEAMRFDSKRNSIWLNTGDGLVEFSPSDKTFRHIDAFNEFTKGDDYDRFVGIDIDKEGNIWFAASPMGIVAYDPQMDKVIPVLSPEQRKIGVNNLHVYCDRAGIVWISDYVDRGLYEVLPFRQIVKRFAPKPGLRDSLSNGMIYNFVPAAEGKMWLGTGDGLNIFDPETETFEVLRSKDLPGIKGEAIIPLGVDTIHQKAWLYAGSAVPEKLHTMDMYEMDLETRTCRQIIFRAGSKRVDPINPLEPIRVKPYKGGLLIFKKYPGIYEINARSLYADQVTAVNLEYQVDDVELEEDRFLFISPMHHMPNFFFENRNGKWTQIPNALDTVGWRRIIKNEKDKTHWVSDYKNKLIHYDKDFREIRSYDPEDGVGMIFQTVIDHGGNIWFLNDLGQIGRLNPETGVISFLSGVDGYVVKDYGFSVPMAIDRRGVIYVGTGWGKGLEGLHIIRANQYSSNFSSTIYVRSLSVNNKPSFQDLNDKNVEALILPHDLNSILIETGIIDYYAMGKGQIRYKLEKNGEEVEWQNGSAYHSIRYDDIAPGSYRLIMQASNTSADFNSPEKILIITITPPYWETWWFRSLALITFISLLFGIVQFRSRSLKMRNEELEEKVIVRTKELKRSIEELSSTQAQLIQSEKMASLGQLTAGIAHEIQNPLNFVKNFSEVSQELLDEMTQEMEKGNLKEAKALSTDVRENLEKVLHHGKRADGIVKGMLQHSRNSSGIKEPTGINNLADEYLRLAFHGLRAKDKTFNATVETNFDQAVGSINVIPQEIGRVILNLITNAFYAVTEKKKTLGDTFEPTVTVATKKLIVRPDDSVGRDKIEISVRDNGSGIPQNIVEKIFQPFFTTKPTGEGTGLGLSLSYDIIKAHGGELKVETQEGEWTVFRIILPAV